MGNTEYTHMEVGQPRWQVNLNAVKTSQQGVPPGAEGGKVARKWGMEIRPPLQNPFKGMEWIMKDV